MQIDKKLDFENHIKLLYSKPSQKLGALQRIWNLLDTQKKNLLFSSIITYQYSYYSLVWMLSSRISNSLLANVHERALKTVYDDHNSS